MNLSPAVGTPDIPVTETGDEGSASTTSSPKSFLSVLTLPKYSPITTGSPNLKVPF